MAFAMSRARLSWPPELAWPSAFAVVFVALCGLVPACRPQGTPPPPTPAGHRSQALRPDLARAVAAWHEHDDIAPLRSWVAQHPDADDVHVWREVVALTDYDACHVDGAIDEARMRVLVQRYPDTVAAKTAIARLSADVLDRLRTSVPSRELVEFLDGGDAWARTGDDGAKMPAVDLAAFHDAHAPELEQSLARVLVADRCRTYMGYCNWWIEHRPAAAETPAIAAARKQAWYDRGHPSWRGGPHARCSYRCAKTCRERATALDDDCWTSCDSRCPGSG
jgi:hypothetical protein